MPDLMQDLKYAPNPETLNPTKGPTCHEVCPVRSCRFSFKSFVQPGACDKHRTNPAAALKDKIQGSFRDTKRQQGMLLGHTRRYILV